MTSRPTTSLTNGLSEDSKYRKFPIISFVYFIEERNNIRLKKEAGEPRPWTSDDILNTCKFTNINRRYDRLSVFHREMLEPIKDNLEQLWLNCLISSHIIKQKTMEHIGIVPVELDSKFYEALIRERKPMFGTAYQCPAQYKTILGYATREEMIFNHLPKVAKETVKYINKRDNITTIIKNVNKHFGFNNTFLNMQALLTLSEIRPDIIDGLSEVPVGVGAKPALKLMYPKLKPEDGIRQLLEIPKVKELCEGWSDVEHALCEWRKWVELKEGIRTIRKGLLYK
jgi:hypothetical protein